MPPGRSVDAPCLGASERPGIVEQTTNHLVLTTERLRGLPWQLDVRLGHTVPAASALGSRQESEAGVMTVSRRGPPTESTWWITGTRPDRDETPSGLPPPPAVAVLDYGPTALVPAGHGLAR